MRRFPYVLLVVLVLCQAAMADNKTEAKEVLRSRLDTVISILQQKDVAKAAKNEQILGAVTPILDFPLMAKLALGRKHWPGLAQDKRDRYTEVFEKRLKETYLEKLNLYTDERVVYLTPVENRGKIYIPTELISKGNKIIIEYKLHNLTGSWKIYDVEVEGVSVVSTYRSQFDQTLSQGTIDDLLQKLENPENQTVKPSQTDKEKSRPAAQ